MVVESWKFVREKLKFIHGSDLPKDLEDTPGLKAFTDEQRDRLEHLGYIGYQLKVQAIRDLVKTGRKIKASSDYYPGLVDFHSREIQVAVNPNCLFLSGSEDKDSREHERMVGLCSKTISEMVPGTKAIIGNVPDYVELVANLIDSGIKFGIAEGRLYTRTKTPSNRFGAPVVGLWSSPEIIVKRLTRDRSPLVGVAPLIVPA